MYMDEQPLTLIHQPSGQGNNSYSLSPTRDSVASYSSLPRIEHEIPYQHIRYIHPITHHFVKAVRLIPSIQHLPYASRKPKATPTGVVVSSVEEAVLATLEGLAKAIEEGEEPLVFWQGEQDTLVILGSDSGARGGGGR